MARVLVTGAAGYVGSVCATQLLNAGHHVTAIDDLSTGHRRLAPQGADFVQGSIGDSALVSRLLATERFDAVFHFAAKALVPESVSNPFIYFKTNVVEALTMLECFRASGVKKLVFSSTAAVYGIPAVSPIPEDCSKSPVNAYGDSKLAFEQILRWYASAYGFSVVAFRYFNACGATGTQGELHDPETHVIPLLMQTASGRRAEFNVYGTDYDTPDGSCLRDYVHILDIADAHLLALDHMQDAGFKAFNIGTGTAYSVLQLCRTVEEVTGRKLKIEYSARRPGDPGVLCASPERIQKEFGWRPKHSDLASICRDAWEWEKKVAGTVEPSSARSLNR